MNDNLLTIDEVGVRLRVCAKTVRTYINEGLLPYVQVPGKRRKLIKASDLERLVQDSKTTAPDVDAIARSLLR